MKEKRQEDIPCHLTSRFLALPESGGGGTMMCRVQLSVRARVDVLAGLYKLS